MDHPYPSENSNPFQTPYQLQPAPTTGGNAQVIKPFAAKDLAPTATPRPILGPGPGPAQSPFLDSAFASPFTQRNPSAAHPASGQTAGQNFIGKPAPMEMHDVHDDFTPVPVPDPALTQGSSPFASPNRNEFQSLPTAQPAILSNLPVMPTTPQAIPQASWNPAQDAPRMQAPPASLQNQPLQPPAAIPIPAAARETQIRAVSAAATAIRPRFFLTTSSTAEGHPIQAYLGVVSVEIVVPKDLLFRNPAAYGELHRMKSAEDHLQLLKDKAMEELTERAQKLQADGIVGVTLQFSQFDAIVCLCSAVGTAVKLSA